MSKLNLPRDIPYDFRVFELHGVVWLLDNSSRTYLCSPEPSVYAEPLYRIDDDDDDLPEAGYWTVRALKVDDSPEKFPKIEIDAQIDTPEREAWQDAREEACANSRI